MLKKKGNQMVFCIMGRRVINFNIITNSIHDGRGFCCLCSYFNAYWLCDFCNSDLCIFYYPIKPKRDNLYLWLDSPYGRDEDLISDLSKIPVNNTLTNLDTLSRRLLVYANFDVKKLRLLKAYFRTLYAESQGETFLKAAFAIFCGPVIIYALNNFDSLMLFKPIEFQDVNPTFLTLFNILAAIFYLCGFLFKMIRGITTNKKEIV